MIIDSARSRGPVSIVKTAATDIQIKRLSNVVKVITIRSTQILISTSRASLMNREGQPMMTCGELMSALTMCRTYLVVHIARDESQRLMRS